MSSIDGSSAPKPARYLVGSERSWFAISQLRIGVWPVLATIGLGLLVILPSGYGTLALANHLSMEHQMRTPWVIGFFNHGLLLLISLALIAWLSRDRLADYGLRWPQRPRYLLAALAWGALFGVLMTVVDYFPQLLARTPPAGTPALTPTSITMWLILEGLYVGPSEELPFRGLMQTYLMQRTSGQVRLGRYEMHVAGVILALLFALAHVNSFWQQPLAMAIGQQFYAFALGILYAYWREKSGSLAASMIGHNASDGVEYALMFLLTWLWR